MTTRATRERERVERIRVEERRKLADHAAGGLRLTAGAVARIEARGRSIVAPPPSETVRAATMASLRAGSSRGVPADVTLALEMLGTLADEGNGIAARLFEHEARRLGLWVDRRLSLPS